MERLSSLPKKTTVSFAFGVVMLLGISAQAQKKPDGFRFIDNIDKKQIDILFNGRLLTAYYYADSVMKPVLFPVSTVSGISVTRGFPIDPRPGERVDHPHHTGLWLSYESVNGLDFWNNSTAIPYNQRSAYGSIVHDGVVRTEVGKNSALLEVTARWVTRENKILLRETTTYNFTVTDQDFIIDRQTTLKALDEDVNMKDIKDGFIAIRVARELEHPSNQPETFVDTHGNYTAVPAINNEGVSGEYFSSEGIKGNEVWGTRATWVDLHGKKDGKDVSITIIDHPKNPGYPTYWHARGYGLFAANPLGQAVFSNGKEKLNFELKKRESATFRYRIVIHEGSRLAVGEIEKLVRNFTR